MCCGALLKVFRDIDYELMAHLSLCVMSIIQLLVCDCCVHVSHVTQGVNRAVYGGI